MELAALPKDQLKELKDLLIQNKAFFKEPRIEGYNDLMQMFEITKA
jgi:hypothetical protein